MKRDAQLREERPGQLARLSCPEKWVYLREGRWAVTVTSSAIRCVLHERRQGQQCTAPAAGFQAPISPLKNTMSSLIQEGLCHC